MPILGRLRSAKLDQDFLDYAATPEDHCTAQYALTQDYYSGFDASARAQGPPLSDRTKKFLERSGLPFSENFCESVIDVFAERLTLSGFTAEDKDAEQDTAPEESALTERLTDLEDWISGIWQKNRMDAKQGTVHTQMLLKGDSYVIVDWDPERVIPRMSYNRPESIPHCVYEEENADHVAWASKVWTTDAKSRSNPDGRAIRRLNVYWPDRVERYFAISKDEGGFWERFTDDAEEWPTPWIRPDGAPLGVPVFHFRHKPLGSDYGRSELRGTIPLQDELNKLVIDLNEIMDMQAWPQRWATGVDGTDASLKAKPGFMHHSQNENARFGQLDPADPSGCLAAIEGCLSRMARRTRTPMHLLVGGTPPSGEALKTAEAGLVAKVKQAQVPLGNVWEDVVLMAVKLAVDQGELEVQVDEENLVLQAAWEDPETRNELAEAQTAEILSGLGVSKHTLLARFAINYDEEAEWLAKERETLDEAAGNLLNAGAGLPGVGSQVPGPEAERNGGTAAVAGYGG